MSIVEPISSVGRRLPTHGRIRTGINTGKYPKSLDTFRFTSPDKAAIEILADIYGAKQGPREWKNKKANPPDQWEVISDSSVIGIIMVPASVELSYELWGNGFRRRSCDGVTCTIRKKVGKTVESESGPCICTTNEKLECSPVTRLNVILPQVPFAGTWLLQSNGWNVFRELPGVANVMAQLKPGEMVQAELSLEKRQADGGSRKFVVPSLRLPQTYDQLTGGEVPELEEVPERVTVDPLAELEEAVVDAEVVDDG